MRFYCLDRQRKWKEKRKHKEIANTEKQRLKRVFSYGDDVPEATVIDESDDYLLQKDKDKCLERLSDKERELIALKQNNSYKEICEDLNIKEGTLRQAFSRAKEKFMECMGFIYDWRR